jgi:hypothetical protein
LRRVANRVIDMRTVLLFTHNYLRIRKVVNC